MDSLNRTLVVGLSGLAALIWLVAVIVALFFFPGAVAITSDVAAFLTQNSGPYVRLMFAAVFAVLFLVSLLLILMAYTPQTARGVVLPRVPGGIALLTPEAIARYLSLGLADLPGVVQVRPQVRPRGGLLDISLEVHILLGVDLVNKTAQVQESIQRTVSQELGLGLGRLHIFYHVEPLPRPQSEGPAASTTS